MTFVEKKIKKNIVWYRFCNITRHNFNNIKK